MVHLSRDEPDVTQSCHEDFLRTKEYLGRTGKRILSEIPRGERANEPEFYVFLHSGSTVVHMYGPKSKSGPMSQTFFYDENYVRRCRNVNNFKRVLNI